MKIYLDDARPCPEGWILAKTAEEAILLLDSGPVEEISLDHDLGDQTNDPEHTGYTVLQHIESRVVWEDTYYPPVIRIHTANSAARPRMEAAHASILRFTLVKQEISE